MWKRSRGAVAEQGGDEAPPHGETPFSCARDYRGRTRVRRRSPPQTTTREVRSRRIPVRIIRRSGTRPVPNTIAFGGVDTGKMKPHVAARPTPRAGRTGSSPAACAAAMTIGTRSAAAAVFEANSLTKIVRATAQKRSPPPLRARPNSRSPSPTHFAMPVDSASVPSDRPPPNKRTIPQFTWRPSSQVKANRRARQSTGATNRSAAHRSATAASGRCVSRDLAKGDDDPQTIPASDGRVQRQAAARRALAAPPGRARTARGVRGGAGGVSDGQVEAAAEAPPPPSPRPGGAGEKCPRPSTRPATRRSSPYFLNASARRKLPTKTKMTGSAYGARTAFAGAIPRITHSAEASRAVAGRGIASVTQ